MPLGKTIAYAIGLFIGGMIGAALLYSPYYLWKRWRRDNATFLTKGAKFWLFLFGLGNMVAGLMSPV